MLKTVDRSTLLLQPSMGLVLLITLSCLMIHFLAEDVFIFSAQVEQISSPMTAEEQTHQDDLVVMEIIPDQESGDVLVRHLPVRPLFQAYPLELFLQPPIR
jgi:hypothetical protein